MKYGELKLGQIEAVVNIMGGMHGVSEFLTGEYVMQRPAVDVKAMKTWLTLTLGTGLKTGKDFKEAVGNAGCVIDRSRTCDYVNQMLDTQAFADNVAHEREDVELVLASGSDLGFKIARTRKEIYSRALEIGLDLCPAEVGPQLCIRGVDLPTDLMAFIAMEPIDIAWQSPFIFNVQRTKDGKRFLCSSRGGDIKKRYITEEKWVFKRRK